MSALKTFLVLLLFVICLPTFGQTTFDEMEIEPDSVKSSYRPAGKNYVLIRSKKGTGGLNKTPAADAITSSEVTEIVLVYSETDAAAIAEREESNRERWENLLMTYPELFQFSTTYKNVCQCNSLGDAETFKKTQGFYVYINGEVPKVEEPKAVETPAAPTPAASTPVAVKTETKKTETPATKTVEKAVTPADNTSVKQKEAPPVIEKKETPVVKQEVVKEPESPVVTENNEESPATEVSKPAAKKKPAVIKARRSSDPKACRQPCYGYGDEDLNIFFKDNIKLTKKQKRKAKGWMSNVRLQIHFDGTIKKAMVTGSNTDFNQMVEGVIKSMNNWNCAVKGGLAVKSEVKFILKYDKETKSMKPFDMIINPRLGPKCKCMTDSEVFGSD
jgi:hypothetical protein